MTKEQVAASLFVDCGDSVVVQLDMSDAADVGRTTAAVECAGGSLGIELLGAAFSLPENMQFRLIVKKMEPTWLLPVSLSILKEDIIIQL